MRVPNLRTAPKRQSLSNVLGQITILTKILKNVYPPRPLFNVGTRLRQIMVAVHIQTSTAAGKFV